MPTVIEKIYALLTPNTEVDEVDVSGRHFLVTGCAEGSLGFATALQLLQRGAVVSVTVRKHASKIVTALQQQLPPHWQGHVYGFNVDLSQSHSVTSFVKEYQQTSLPLHVLINNAGIHLDLLSQWQQARLSEDGVEIHRRVNYLGTAQLTMALLPLLIDAGANGGDSRIINVVSQLHSKGLNSEFFQAQRPYNSWQAYGQSKLALMHFTHSLSQRFASQGISSYSLHPGAVYTNIATQGLANTGRIERLRHALAALEKLFLKTPQQGAKTTILCATALKHELQTGAYYCDAKLGKAASDAHDHSVSEQLWLQLDEWLCALAAAE